MARKDKGRNGPTSYLMLDYDADSIRSLSDVDLVNGLLHHAEARYHSWDEDARRGDRLTPIFEGEVYRRMKASASA